MGLAVHGLEDEKKTMENKENLDMDQNQNSETEIIGIWNPEISSPRQFQENMVQSSIQRLQERNRDYEQAMMLTNNNNSEEFLYFLRRVVMHREVRNKQK